ncbi:MAG: hypothetical protein RMK75_08010, partial [Aquificaceae bacterium]|nr:hypothetical protein [Aquificaceae bacterium]MDW8424245.1 hypothetical protein [Aquificaceae bacterium]
MAKRFGYDCPDFVGEELTFGRRAEATNISPVKAKSFWAGENVLYGLEREVILKGLKKEAEELVRKFKEAGSLNWDIVLQKWDSLKMQIKTSYTGADRKLTTEKEEYTKRNLQKSYNVGMVFKILTFVFILIETIVMLGSSVPQGLEEGSSPDFVVVGFSLLLAIFLAGGGWLVGMFLSILMFDRHLKANNIGEKDLITVVHWLLLIGGFLLILFISITRLVAGGFGLFLFTIILGLIISA